MFPEPVPFPHANPAFGLSHQSHYSDGEIGTVAMISIDFDEARKVDRLYLRTD